MRLFTTDTEGQEPGRGRLRTAVVAGLAIVALAIAACGDDSSSTDSGTGAGSSKSSTAKVEVAAALPDIVTFPAYKGEHAGMKAAAAKQGVDLKVATTTGTFNDQKYQDAIDSVIASGRKVVVMDAYDPVKYAAVVRRLTGQGVKVVLVNTGPVATSSSAINTDTPGSVEAGIDAMLEQLPPNPKIGLLVYPSNGIVTERMNLAKAALKSRGATIVGETPMECTTPVKGANAAQDLMQAHPDVQGIFVGCGTPGVGAARAVRQAGKKVVVFSYDGSDDELELVKSGLLGGTIRTKFEDIGARAISVMASLAKGEAVEKQYLLPADIVTKENIDQFLK